MVASGTPCDESGTVSRSGHTVAAMRLRMSARASSGTSTRKGRISVAAPWATAVMTGSASCARWIGPRPVSGSAEREGEGPQPGVVEGDLERAAGDRAVLADQLVQPRLGDRAGAIGIHVVPGVVARRLPVEAHGEAHRAPAVRW